MTHQGRTKMHVSSMVKGRFQNRGKTLCEGERLAHLPGRGGRRVKTVQITRKSKKRSGWNLKNCAQIIQRKEWRVTVWKNPQFNGKEKTEK